MKTIYKYPLAIQDVQTIQMPLNAEILCVQMQHGIPCLWALVDTSDGTLSREIRIYGTGHPIEIQGQYIGTFQLQDGKLVFHVFE